MSVEEFQKVMLYLTTAYPSANITGMTTKLYFEHLKDIPFQTMEKAAVRVVETSHFFPSIAELRETCLKLQNPDCNKSELDALDLLQNSITKYGRYRQVEAMDYIKENDPVLYKIVKTLGFKNLCDTDCKTHQKEIGWLYKNSVEDMRRENQLTGNTVSTMIRLEKKIKRQALSMQNYDEF